MIWIFLFISIMRGLKGDLPRPSVGRYENAEPEQSWQPEYQRERPYEPVPDDKPLPKPE
jgi:hypothetical protein